MLRSWRQGRAVGAALVMAMAAAALPGCSQDREQALIGTWQARPTSIAIGMGKGNVPAGEAAAGAATLATMKLRFRKSKNFALEMPGGAMEGTWKLDKESGVITMNITKWGGKEMPPGGAPWTAKMTDDNTRISFETPATPGSFNIGDISFEKQVK